MVRKVIAGMMVVAAVGLGAYVFVLQQSNPEADQPLGALCMGLPAIGLLIGAGMVWGGGRKR
jgi:hypothetical protein